MKSMKSGRRQRRWTKTLLRITLLLVVAAAVFLGARRVLLGAPAALTTPRRGPLIERRVLTGRVISPGIGKLGVTVLGTVAEVNVREGDRAAVGQELVRLRDAEQRAEVAKARAALASAKV